MVRELKSKSDIADLSRARHHELHRTGCTRLVGDAELIPIKGQLSVLLPQPEIDYTVLQDHYYMFPRRDGILLGGTFERNESGSGAGPRGREAGDRRASADLRSAAENVTGKRDSCAGWYKHAKLETSLNTAPSNRC